MADRHHHWRMDGADQGWRMPPAPSVKRLPLIRHIRAIRLLWRVEQHNDLWQAAGLIPTGYDHWVPYGIWHGLEAPQ